MKKSLFLFPVLWSLGLMACSGGSMDEMDPQSEVIEEGSEAEAALAGILPPQRCERLQIKLTSQGASNSTTINVPGPYKASLSSDGKKMSCTGPTGDFIATKFLEDFFANFTVRFMVNNNNTGLLFQNPLEAQQTTIRWQGTALGPTKRGWPSQTKILSCHPYTATISAPGFGEQRISVVAELNGFPTQVGRTFTTGCRYRVKGPVTLTRDRPAEITGTSGDRFIYAPPPFCDGDDCKPVCAPANQCRATSDCGAPGRLTCSNGCCLTVIR
ncbi:MAG TPA: hypothetical protein VJV79_10375 [Polyangiaceae bacterium]|nr:hypothetical protein [Polyangiaceae bacterium]